MTITVDIGGTRHPATLPHEGAKHVIVDMACPLCRAESLQVSGRNQQIDGNDTYAADAVAVCCGRQVGTLRVRVETLFGIEEDEAVLRYGRARVY